MAKVYQWTNDTPLGRMNAELDALLSADQDRAQIAGDTFTGKVQINRTAGSNQLHLYRSGNIDLTLKDESQTANSDQVRFHYQGGNLSLGMYDSSTWKNQIKCLGGDLGVVQHAPGTVAGSSTLEASTIHFYLDEAGNTLKVKVKYADGSTIKTGSISLA